MTPDRQNELLKVALQLLALQCPRLLQSCYWAGIAAVSLEDLHHRQSFDLDFHTKKALLDVRPLLTEMQHSFPKDFEIVQGPDEFGSGFQGALALPEGGPVTIEVLSNYEDVSERDLVDSKSVAGLKRVSLSRYLADKIQCVAERTEARDLVDIAAVLDQHPEMEKACRRLLANQDAVILVERLISWSDDALDRDLAAYDDVKTADARTSRDLLLRFVKEAEPGDDKG